MPSNFSGGALYNRSTAASATPFRRRTLIDLSDTTYCSILGTCLTLSELRKVVTKLGGDTIRRIPDHDVHMIGVIYAGQAGWPTKLLTKTLDEKHAGIIRRMKSAASEEILRESWAIAKRDGAIEGMYWALATHPLASEAFFSEVYADVHMLSHLVGASNRADIKRLAQLERERDELVAETSSLRSRLRDERSRLGKELQSLRQMLSVERPNPIFQDAASEERSTVMSEKIIQELQKTLRTEAARAEGLRQTVESLRTFQAAMKTETERLQKANIALSDEARELERALTEQPLKHSLNGRAILYVGGVARGIKSIRAAIEELGGTLVHHDGGREQAVILLRGLVARADIVLCPVDFVSHEAALTCKRVANQLGKTFLPLPHSGVGSVLRALREQATN